MKIAVDAFGGDNAPDAVLKGASMAVSAMDIEIVLTGDEKRLKDRMSALDLSYKNIAILHADGVIQIEDNPLDIRTEKAGTSMGKAIRLLADGAVDAVVSAGSTAALTVGGTMVVGRIKGVKRPALAPIMPGLDGYYMLLDGGANLECRPEMLLQFGLMGSVYMEKIMGVDKPRVGLLNVGTEEEKGRELEHKAYALLQQAPIHFIGNIEGRDPTLGGCDVVVADGFTGNVYLKAIEGMGKFIKSGLKEIFMAGAGAKVGYLLAKKGVKQFAEKMDYKNVGGSPLLGTARPVIKAHGSSDAVAFMNAIRQAKEFVDADAIAAMTDSIRSMKE